MKLKAKEALTGITLTAPFLAGFLVFFIIPFGISVFYTFTFGVGATKFVGLHNYVQVLGNSAFRLAIGNTFKFIGIGVPLVMVLSLLLAIAFQKKFGGSGIFRSIFLYPMVILIASTVMFFQVLFADKGVVNFIMNALDLPVQNWLQSSNAFEVLVFLYVWKNCGYNIILFLTGLNAIPKDYEEVANIEGATGLQYFRFVTLPLLIPSFLFVFVISVINSFKSFREAFLLSGAMPHKSIYMLQHFMNNNFENLNYQRLSVAALLTFAIIFMFVIFLFILKGRTTEENG